MRGKSVLVHTRDEAGARAMARCLRAAGSEVAQSAGLAATLDLIGARAVDLVLIEHGDRTEVRAVTACARRNCIPVVVAASRAEPVALLDLMCDQGVTHLLGASAVGPHAFRGVEPREVLVTIEKLLQRDLFGIERYLPGFGVDVARARIGGLADRDAAIDHLGVYLESLGVEPPLAATLCLVADELVTNAMRHAGRVPHASPRIDLVYACDGEELAMSVRDDGGRLTPEAIRDALDVSDHAGGLGLLAVFHSSTQLVFDLAPGRATEVIAIAQLRSGAELATAARSLHVFVAHPEERTAAVPELAGTSVQLSESMRVDLRSQLAAIAAPGVLPRRAAPGEDQPPALPPRTRRPKATPNPLAEVYQSSIGLDTLRAILRGATCPDAALESALRYLANDCAAVLAYRRDAESLVLHMAAGRVRGWWHLGQLEPWLRAPSTPAIVARDRSLRAFAPQKRGLDRRIIEMVDPPPPGQTWAIPIAGDDEALYVICAVAPAIERMTAIRVLLEVRSELEDALERIAAPRPRELAAMAARHGQRQRAAADPPYADLELIFARPGRAPTEPPYDALEVQLSRAASEPYVTIELVV